MSNLDDLVNWYYSKKKHKQFRHNVIEIKTTPAMGAAFCTKIMIGVLCLTQE